MLDISNVKNKDIVRVVLEGPVEYLYASSFDVGEGPWSNTINSNADHVKSIEIVKPYKPPLNVGDVVALSKILLLPNGTVVTWNLYESAACMVVNGKLIKSDSGDELSEPNSSTPAWKILFIPEVNNA